MAKRTTVREFILIQQVYGTEIEELSPTEVKAYKNRWYRTFVPLAEDDDRLRAVCLGVDDDRIVPRDSSKDVMEYGSKGFLWRIYRDEAVTECKKGGYAKAAFNRQPKKDMILVDNFYCDNAAYLIRNVPDIKADVVDRLTDVTLTDVDFKWTYSKTHEEGQVGPYFYRK